MTGAGAGAGAGADLTGNTGQLTTTVPSGLVSASTGVSSPVGFFTTTGGAGEGAVGVLITPSYTKFVLDMDSQIHIFPIVFRQYNPYNKVSTHHIDWIQEYMR